MHKNSEGYPDPTAGKAMQAAGRTPPERVTEMFRALDGLASIMGLEVTGLRDKKTGKEWRRKG